MWYHSANGRNFDGDSHLLLIKLLFIMANFNYPGIDWETQVALDSAPTDAKFFIDSFFLQSYRTVLE